MDTVMPIAAGIIGVLGALAFVIAAPRAWRAGVAGFVLPKGWAIGSLVLFGVGAVSLVLTTPHAEDLEQTAAACEHDCRHSPPLNSISTDIHGVVVEPCESADWSIVMVADADGWVSSLADGQPPEYMLPHEFALHIGWEIDRLEEIAQMREDSPIPLQLAFYVDERAPTLALYEYLRVAREQGVRDVLLYGQAYVEHRSATQGAWTRRILCPAGSIQFDDAATSSSADFATWSELQHAAIERGDAPLELRLPILP
jgi:hypothetical protein